MSTNSFLLLKKILTLSIFLSGFVYFGSLEKTRSANLSSVSVTLGTPRLSFVGKLDSGNSVGSSLVHIVSTANGASSTTSAQLVEGDVVLIGDGGTAQTYTVASSSATASQFLIRTPSAGTLQSNNADSGDAVIATRSGSITVRFTTASAVANGAFQVLIPATSLSGSSARADGIPDQDGFDFGSSTPSVTCPGDVGSSFDFVSGTATASATTLSGVAYHAYECRYSGSGATATAFDGSSQGTISISSIINPSPKVNHVQGYTDIYQVIIRNLNSVDSAVDSTAVTVGNVESVRVTADVPEQITFAVLGLSSSTSTCGQTTSVTSTSTSVPFGTVTTTGFGHGSQSLTVSTNAVNGFSVTITADDQLGKNHGACPGDPPSSTSCIPDAGVTGMSHTTSQDWTSTTQKGLGYSLQDPTGNTNESFVYNESGRSFSAKQLPDNENSQSAQTIFSSGSLADTHNVYVCYRVIVPTTVLAGSYENVVTYRATASF